MDLTVNKAILLEVADEELIQRLSKRAKAEGRDDDNEETIRKRMKVYHRQTEPLFNFYEAKKKMLRIDGMGSADEVTARIQGALS